MDINDIHIGDEVVIKTQEDYEDDIRQGKKYHAGYQGYYTPNGTYVNPVMFKVHGGKKVRVTAIAGQGEYRLLPSEHLMQRYNIQLNWNEKYGGWTWSNYMVKPVGKPIPPLSDWNNIFNET